MLHPAPDFVVEILSRRTSRTDRVIKYADYARHGVGEYWIIDAKKRVIEQHILPVSGERTYVLRGKFEAGDEVSSVSIPGFVIPVSAVFDKTENMAALRKIV
jgi:Uma2 family endonuclease